MPVLDCELESHYRVLVSKSEDRPKAQLYPFNLQQPLPTFDVPLRSDDSAVGVDLTPLLSEIYDLSGYDLDLDYHQDPAPKWPASELAWLDNWLKQKHLR